MSCSSAPTPAPILHPYAAICPQTTPKQHCKCAHRCPICPNASPFPALLAPSSTQSCDNREQGALWGRCWRIGGLWLGTAQSRAHYVPRARPSCTENRKAAPIAGVCMGVGWLVGVALQGMGVLRQTSRSQSEGHGSGVLSAINAIARSASTISFTRSLTVLLCCHPSSVHAFEGLPVKVPCSSHVSQLRS